MHANMQTRVQTATFATGQPASSNKQSHYSIRCQPLADTGHRRCTFITGSTKASPTLSPCLNRPRSHFSCLSVSWSCRCCRRCLLHSFLPHLAASIGALKAAQQKSMSKRSPLSQSLDTLFWGRMDCIHGPQYRSIILNKGNRDTSHILSHTHFLTYLPFTLHYNLM